MSDTFGHPGADLSMYREELSRGRSSRTLALRRVNRPTISGSLGVSGNVSRTNRTRISREPQYQAFTVENTLAIFQSGNESSISSHCSKISELSSLPKIITNLAQSEDVCQALVSFLSEGFQDSTKVFILSAIGTLFVLSNNLKEEYADNLAIIFIEFLESQTPELIFQTIQVISTLVLDSGYARDSILTFGIQDMLANIALSEIEPNITLAATSAIYNIYVSPDDIDISIMQGSVPLLKQLFGLSNVAAVRNIILTFSELANKNPSIVYVYFDNGIYQIAMQLLQNPELVADAIVLVGNLSIGKRQHIQVLLENNLFQILIELYSEESIRSEVLWVISNLIESSAPLVLPLIEPAFISDILSTSVDGSFEVKKESAYLISTLIVTVPSESLNLFLLPQVAESLVEMSNCGVSLVVTKCLTAIIRLVIFVTSGNDGGEFIPALLQSEIVDHLQEIQQSDMDKAKEPASALMILIDSLQQEGE